MPHTDTSFTGTDTGDFAVLAAESRAAQGLPPVVEDDDSLREAVRVIGTARRAADLPV